MSRRRFIRLVYIGEVTCPKSLSFRHWKQGRSGPAGPDSTSISVCSSQDMGTRRDQGRERSSQSSRASCAVSNMGYHSKNLLHSFVDMSVAAGATDADDIGIPLARMPVRSLHVGLDGCSACGCGPCRVSWQRTCLCLKMTVT
jgi:hypothetical protein